MSFQKVANGQNVHLAKSDGHNVQVKNQDDLVKKREEIEKRKAKERMSDGGKGVEILPHLKGQSAVDSGHCAKFG